MPDVPVLLVTARCTSVMVC